MTRTLQELWMPFTVALAAVAFSTSFGANFTAPKLLGLRLSLVAGLTLLWIKWHKERKLSIPVHPWLFLALAFLFLLLFSSFGTPIFWLAQERLFEWLSLVLFFLLALLLMERFNPEGATLLEWGALVPVGYGFLQHFRLDPIRWTPGGTRIFSTLGQADEFSTYLVMLMGISLVRFLEKPALFRFFLIEAEALAIFWSYTRAPLLALLAGLGVLFLLVSGLRKLRPLLPRLIFVALCLTATFLFVLAQTRQTPEGKRFQPGRWASEPSIVGRGYLLRKGVETLALYPWKGTGPGNFPFLYLPLRVDDPPFYRQRLGMAESTHNAFLDAAVETGFAGGACFLFLWMVSLYKLLAGIRQASLEEACRRISALIPLVISLVSLQFIYLGVGTACLSAYLLLVPASLSPAARFERPFRAWRAWVTLLALGAVLLAGALLVYSLRTAAAEWEIGSGHQAMKAERWPEAARSFQQAVRWNPWDPIVRQKLGKAYEALGLSRPALDAYTASAALNPMNPYAWADLGRLAAENRWPSLALRAYAESIRLDPYNPVLAHDAALAALNLGRPGLGLYFARQAYDLNPDNPSNGTLLVLALQGSGKIREAGGLAARLIKKFPDNAELRRLVKPKERG